MTDTLSAMSSLGVAAPDFTLPDYDGKLYSVAEFRHAKGLMVAFICNHCPFVRHVRNEFARFAREYQARGLAVVAIASNDVAAYPQDGPAGMKTEAETAGYSFPYLFDATQAAAKAYQAACTPDFYLFDGNQQLIYHGQFDGSRPGKSVPVTGADLRAAADALLAGRPPLVEQLPSIGCSIKWKPGNQPAPI
jgi:peroxiredoxin